VTSIVLQFVGGNDPLSKLIKDFERGWCSHVDAVLDSGELLGARLDGGVAIRPANYETFAQVKRVGVPAPDATVQEFYGFLRAQLGKPYDEWAIAGFAVGRDWRSPDHWFCSELIAAGLEQAHWFPEPLSETANFITPRDLELVLSPWVDLLAVNMGAQ
jgi:hypothetical protein